MKDKIIEKLSRLKLADVKKAVSMVYGIEFSRKNIRLDEVVDMIESVDPEFALIDTLDIASEEEQPEPETPIPGQKRVKLIIHNGDELSGGDRPVHVTINGYSYKIPREKEVMVPEAVINVLKDAKIVRYYEDKKTGKMIGKETNRFAYSVSR